MRILAAFGILCLAGGEEDTEPRALTGKRPWTRRLIAALACAAPLAFGACSGGNPPAPADPENEIADPETAETETTETETAPETADPVADGRTEAERFDAAHAKAEADLAAARSMVTNAAATSAGIAAARKALTDALAAARALHAPPDDSGRTARAARLAVKAGAAEAEDIPRLRAAASSAGWAGSSALVIGRENLRPVPEIPSAVRYQRETEAGRGDPTRAIDADTLLTAAKIPAVMHEDGKVVMAPGLRSSGDRLRMRGIPVAYAGQPQTAAVPGDNRLFLYMGPAVDPRPFVDPAGDGNNGEEPKLVAGLRITPGGLVVDMGGRGAFGLDFRLPGLFQTIRGFVAPDGSDGGYDLKLTFGAPRASPEGNAEHYWTAALMPNSELAAAIGSSRLRDGQELGVYTMRLSNHAGLDRNLEDPDDPAASARDDVNHYLSYAVYGHMEFFDSFVTPATNLIPGRRTFPFHAGYDAFKDEAGMRTTDVADADKITGGTFRGRTLASQFAIAYTGPAGFYPSLTGAHSLTLRDANYLRLRGDVTLTATISGTAADNRINGKITNLESFSNSKRIWEDYAGISGALTLQATGISASGRFAGVIPTPAASVPNFDEGGYRGNFYGPSAGLEAAGIWHLQDGNTTSSGLRLSIVGSFGAALVRDDGAYGVEVRPVGD